MTPAPGPANPDWRSRWALRRELRKAAAGIDRAAVEAARKRFDAWAAAYESKYWDLEHQLAKNLLRARRLGLHRPPADLRVLDLGTGAGFFPFACRFYGHRATGMDLDDSDGPSIYRELTGILRVERRLHSIERFKPLPALDGTFDLVTGFAVQFNNPAQGETWGADEWRHLLEDLSENVLAPSGRVYFELVLDRTGHFWNPGVGECFEEAGGRLAGREVYFPGPPTVPAAPNRAES
jgi:SAM-dependent methyltransferase